MDQVVLDRIKQIVTDHPVVLFMKGTPKFPQCGFSNVAAQVLTACGTEFFAVNVLQEYLGGEAPTAGAAPLVRTRLARGDD
jgi:monothiol glutaredoxin